MKLEEDGIRFFADALETLHCDQKCGVHLEGALKVVTDGDHRMEKERIVDQRLYRCTDLSYDGNQF